MHTKSINWPQNWVSEIGIHKVYNFQKNQLKNKARVQCPHIQIKCDVQHDYRSSMFSIVIYGPIEINIVGKSYLKKRK